MILLTEKEKKISQIGYLKKSTKITLMGIIQSRYALNFLDTKVIYEKNSITAKVYGNKRNARNLNVTLLMLTSLRFIKSEIKQFSQKTSKIVDFIIPPSLFEILKKVVLVEITYCPKNEVYSKQFIQKFDELTDSLYDIQKR